MNAPLRRGACPGLSAPMQTGDGLLVRMLPIGTIPLAAFSALCAAARQHGNGIVEVTARGSIQVRGLSPVSAPRFAATVAALGIAADGIAVHTSPLAGFDPDEILDAETLAVAVRAALAGHAMTAPLSPKISVAIDGGGALDLDRLSADIRLRAELKDRRAVLAVSVGGDRGGATLLGFVAPANAAMAVVRLIGVIAEHGRNARARDLAASECVGQFHTAIGALLLSSDPALESRSCGNQRTFGIGAYRLRGGSLACGIGLAFGHADTASLESLTDVAVARGATGLRAAPDRALIFNGFSPAALSGFTAAAEQLGFIVRADDPRRFVVACAGAPICASAHIAARTLAPRIAAACASTLGERLTIHVSGCVKGCAHPAPAALTVVGTAEGSRLVADGAARDTPFAAVKAEDVPAAIAGFASEMTGKVSHV